jgi:phospholipid/cholesterol/gamma-HCH transport system permease protein
MFPVLYVLAASTGIAGGVFTGYFTGALPVFEFMKGARLYFFPWDVLFGFVKMFVFGFLITSIASYKGYYATGGAEGVGKSTTQATVLGCLYVVTADFVLAALLL